MNTYDLQLHSSPKKINAAFYYPSETIANPSVLLSSSKQYSTFEVYNSNSGSTSPVLETKDDNYLGGVYTKVYQQVGNVWTGAVDN